MLTSSNTLSPSQQNIMLNEQINVHAVPESMPSSSAIEKNGTTPQQAENTATNALKTFSENNHGSNIHLPDEKDGSDSNSYVPIDKKIKLENLPKLLQNSFHETKHAIPDKHKAPINSIKDILIPPTTTTSN